MFLAPAPGAIHIFSNDEGMEKQQRCIEKGKGRLVFEERTCCFKPASGDGPPITVDIPGYTVLPTPKEPWSIEDQYTLYTDGTKLIRTAFSGDITLIDLARETWVVPMSGSPGMPKEGTCKVVSKKWMSYRGKDRLIVVVECTASLNDAIVHKETWTLASGLGFIAMDDFKLTSIEKQSERS